MQSIRVHGSDHGRSLAEFLALRLTISGKQAKRLLDARSVFVNRRRVWMARHALATGDVVEVQAAPRGADAPKAAPTEPRILLDLGDVLVVDKPAGRLSTGPDSIEAWLHARKPGEMWKAVHRLDRDTTGCMILARDGAPLERMIGMFEERTVRKTYQAIALGRVDPAMRRIRHAVDGLEAITEFRVRESNRRATWLEAYPLTGRTHQIRVHLRTAGHPLAGDRVYATREIEDDAIRSVPRQMLHAWKISWKDPATGQVVRAESPLPADFRQALKDLELARPGGPRRAPRVTRGDGT